LHNKLKKITLNINDEIQVAMDIIFSGSVLWTGREGNSEDL
jgi:hypothetical protein